MYVFFLEITKTEIQYTNAPFKPQGNVGAACWLSTYWTASWEESKNIDEQEIPHSRDPRNKRMLKMNVSRGLCVDGNLVH